jgi:hypothetical protein
MLAQTGIIPQTRIAQFMELPDIQSGYSLSNNAINAVLTCINNCIEKDIFNVPDFIPFTMLKEEIINTQLALTSAGFDKNKKDILKLDKLYETVEDMAAEWETTAAEENPQTNNANDAALPYNQNVLEQEANMQMVDPNAAAPDNAAWVDSNDLDRV